MQFQFVRIGWSVQRVNDESRQMKRKDTRGSYGIWRTKWRWPGLIPWLMVYLVVVSTGRGNAIEKVAAPTLVVELGKGITRPDGGSYIVDVGTVDAVSTETINCRVILKNPSGRATRISYIETGCNCTLAILKPAGSIGDRLYPGASVPMDILIDATHFPAGKMGSQVMVYTDGANIPAVQINVTGVIVPAIQFSAPVLACGRVPIGAKSAIPFDVSINTKLVDALRHMKLAVVPAVAGVRVISQKIDDVLGASPRCRFTCELDVDGTARVGDLQTRVRFVRKSGPITPNVSQERLPSVSQERYMKMLEAASLPVVGSVIDVIGVDPISVNLGLVTDTTDRSADVQLSGVAATEIQNISLVSDQKWLQAVVTNKGVRVSSPGITIPTVTIAFKFNSLPPAGPFYATITLSDGVRNRSAKLTVSGLCVR